MSGSSRHDQSSTSDESENLTSENEVSCEDTSLAEPTSVASQQSTTQSTHSSHHHQPPQPHYHYIIEQPNSTSIRYIISPPSSSAGGVSRGQQPQPHHHPQPPTGHNLHHHHHRPNPAHLFVEPPHASYPKGLAAAYQFMQSSGAATFTKKPPGQFITAPSSQISARELVEKSNTMKQPSGVMTTTNSGPEYVSIRYFAPVSQVNPRLMKGEMVNPHHHQPIKRDSSRPKLTTPITPGIHFAPNIDPSFSFNYTAAANQSKIFAPSPQPGQQQIQPLMQGPSYDFAISPYRMINFEMKQFGQQPNNGDNQRGDKQSQQEQSYQRPVSSMWNIAGGAGNTGSLSHKFMSEYSDELKNYGNYFSSGEPNNGGFFNRFVSGSDKQFRSGAKYGLFTGALVFTVLLITGAVFLGIFIANKLAINQPRMAMANVERSQVSVNTTFIDTNSTQVMNLTTIGTTPSSTSSNGLLISGNSTTTLIGSTLETTTIGVVLINDTTTTTTSQPSVTTTTILETLTTQSTTDSTTTTTSSTTTTTEESTTTETSTVESTTIETTTIEEIVDVETTTESTTTETVSISDEPVETTSVESTTTDDLRETSEVVEAVETAASEQTTEIVPSTTSFVQETETSTLTSTDETTTVEDQEIQVTTPTDSTTYDSTTSVEPATIDTSNSTSIE